VTLTHGLSGYTALKAAEHVEPFTVRVITLLAGACVTLLPFGRAITAGVEQLEEELLLPLLLPPP
jgi:predicted alpha/beta hydrolase family esterase